MMRISRSDAMKMVAMTKAERDELHSKLLAVIGTTERVQVHEEDLLALLDELDMAEERERVLYEAAGLAMHALDIAMGDSDLAGEDDSPAMQAMQALVPALRAHEEAHND